MKNNKNQLKAFSLIELSIVVLIIGLIVAGVLGGKKLVELSSLSKARTLTNSSPVNGIEDLVFWLETTSKDSIPPAQAIDGTTITTWYNLNPQVNNKNNLIQGGTYSGPVYRTATINGLPSLSFEGNSEQILISTDSITSESLVPTNQVTIFMVGKFNGDKGGNKTFFGFTEATVASRISFESLANSGTTGFRFFYGASGFVDSTQSIANNFIISAVKDATTQYVYMNGALSVSGANAQSLTSFSNQLTIGGYRPQASALAAKSYIGEFIMFNRALSDFERQQVEQYLSKKWGIKLA